MDFLWSRTSGSYNKDQNQLADRFDRFFLHILRYNLCIDIIQIWFIPQEKVLGHRVVEGKRHKFARQSITFDSLHQGHVVRRWRQILVVVLGYHCVSPCRCILYLGYFSKKKITHTCGQGQTSPGLRPPSAKDAWSCSLAFHWTESSFLTGQHTWQTNPSISWLSEYILSGEAERCFTISRLVQSTCNFKLTFFFAPLKD